MGATKLKKVELYYHRSVQEDVAETLQRSGMCQIIGEPQEEARPADAGERLALCEEQQAHMRYLFRALEGYYVDPVSSVERMLGERPVFSVADLERLAQDTDLGAIASSVQDKEHRLNELRVEVSQLSACASTLSKIETFPYSLGVLGEGTRSLKGMMGTLPSEQLGALREGLEEFRTETELYVSGPHAKSKEAWAVVMYVRAREPQILELCARKGMLPVELPLPVTGTVAAERQKISDRLAECAATESAILGELERTAQDAMPMIQKLSDYWGILSARYQALQKSATTERTLKTCFWVPETAWGSLRKQIDALSPVTAYVALDPTEEDTPPTLLRNRPLVRPFEILTNLYSPPPYGETDPSPLLAPFFFLFFGMCLGDAGYAVVMMAGIWMLFRKYRRIPQNVREFVLLFALGAVSTLLYGVISGSFFGDFIDAFFFMAPLRGLKEALTLVDPMKNPMQILGISLLLGWVHLMSGLAIAAYDCLRDGRYLDAIGDKISWVFFISGLGLFFVASDGTLPPLFLTLGKVSAVVGALVIFWYAGREKKNILSKLLSGFLALYGSTAYLGDILSYSRLLALGFGSGVIGMIINLLGGMAAEIPYIGWAIATMVVVGGHLFGIAINLLGAFVHALRLQYVEFFGKFYSGGGSPFEPLTLSTQYVEIAERH